MSNGMTMGGQLYQYLQNAFAENTALKIQWDKEPISNSFRFNPETIKDSQKIGKGDQMINEATEYYILEKLSTHLTDYFQDPKFSEQYLYTFARNDIPDVLLSNRFFELFTKSMEDRPLFSKDVDNLNRAGDKILIRLDDNSETEGEVVTAMSKGALYNRFDLTLPKGANVRRGELNSIIIETKRFTLSITVDFSGFSAVLPWEYEHHILGIDPKKHVDYKIDVELKVSFKPATLFLPGGWEYYRWIESFMETFEMDFSEEKHFTNIGWETTLTQIQYFENRMRTKKNRKG